MTMCCRAFLHPSFQLRMRDMVYLSYITLESYLSRFLAVYPSIFVKKVRDEFIVQQFFCKYFTNIFRNNSTMGSKRHQKSKSS